MRGTRNLCQATSGPLMHLEPLLPLKIRDAEVRVRVTRSTPSPRPARSCSFARELLAGRAGTPPINGSGMPWAGKTTQNCSILFAGRLVPQSRFDITEGESL
jgi:hypothetical protein